MAITKIIADSITSGAIGNTPSFQVTQSSSQTFSANTTTKITYDTEVYNVGGGFNTTNNNFTVPSGEAGKYFFYIQTQGIFTDNSTQVCGIALFVNGTQTKYTRNKREGVGTDTSFFNSSIVDLSVGDVVDARLYHSFSTSRSNDVDATVTYFTGFKLL